MLISLLNYLPIYHHYLIIEIFDLLICYIFYLYNNKYIRFEYHELYNYNQFDIIHYFQLKLYTLLLIYLYKLLIDFDQYFLCFYIYLISIFIIKYIYIYTSSSVKDNEYLSFGFSSFDMTFNIPSTIPTPLSSIVSLIYRIIVIFLNSTVNSS